MMLCPVLRVYGERLADEAHFLRLVSEKNLAALASIDRDFVAVVSSPGKDIVVTSGSGVQPYFVGYSAAGAVHGRTVAEVAAKIGVEWDWDYRALSEYLKIALVTGGRTFHRGIRHLQRGRFVVFADGCMPEEVCYTAPAFESSIPADVKNPEQLVSALLAEIAVVAGRHSSLLLSASGGLDARVLLATLLKLRIPIQLLVSGAEGSTDRTIVESIAASYRLDMRAITLKADDFLRNFAAISLATGGGLALDHWYGFLHLSCIAEPDATVLMGIGGEVCRSHYFDHGLESLLLNHAPWLWRIAVLRQRLQQRGSLHSEHIQHLAAPLAAELQPESLDALALHHAQLAFKGRSDSMDGLDRFFVEQEIAYEQGLQLLGTSQIYSGQVINPFTRSEFIRGARGLSRRMKLGGRFHRIAINQLEPSLMNFPEYGSAHPMRSIPPSFYWLRQQTTTTIGYVDTTQFASNEFDGLFKANAHELSHLISDELISRLSSRQSRLPIDARLFWTLLPIAVFLTQFRQSKGHKFNCALS